MKKENLFALIVLIALAVPASAQKAGQFGAGVVLGAPTGATGKLWLGDAQAIDAGLGWNGALTVYGDYLWHGWTLLPQPPQGRMPVYVGLGAQVRAYNDSEVSLRAVVGIAYWLPKDPIEIFAELVPLLHLTRHTGAGLDGAAGVRYYFN